MEFKVKKNQEIPTKTGINSKTPDRMYSKHPIRNEINKLKIAVDGVGDAVEVGPIPISTEESNYNVQKEAQKIRAHVSAIYQQISEHNATRRYCGVEEIERKKFTVRSVYKPDGGYIKVWRIPCLSFPRKK